MTNKYSMFGDCPKCGKSWFAGDIPKKYKYNYSPPYKYSNLVSKYSRELDRTVHYQCPYCDAQFELDEVSHE